MHLLRDHIERLGRGFKRCDRYNYLINRVSITAGDGLQGHDQLAGHDGGVDRVVWLGGVATFALDVNVELIGGCEKRTRADRKVTGRQARPVVHSVDFLDAPAVHHAVVAHLFAAAAAFFGGLENDHDSAIKIAGFGQVLRGPQQHRGMPIVTTSVHRPVRERGIFNTCRLVNWQCIHVSAQADNLARLSLVTFDYTDNARAPDARHHLVTPKGAQFVCNQRAGAVRFK